MENLSDSALVPLLQRGDAAAFDEAYRRYRPRLYGFLLRLVQRKDVAEDLLQETWIRLATHATSLADDTNLGAWLFTVARNLFRSHRRWALLHAVRLRTMELLPQPDPKDTPFDLAAAGETGRRLEAALAAVPSKYREVVLLCTVEQLDHTEAARVLSLTPEALRQRLSRARSMLEQELSRKEKVA